MDFELSTEQRELVSRIHAFASGIERAGAIDDALWKACGTAGLHGLCLPREYGGQGLPALDTALALEALGYGCRDGGLAFAVGAQLLSCSVPISLHATEATGAHLLPLLCRGELRATNAMTEASGGSAAFQMEARAESLGEEYRLSGCKSWCANAPQADICLAYVVTDSSKGFAGGVSAFLLDRSRHAFEVTGEVSKLGLRSCPTGQVSLDGVAAGAGDMLGKPGAGGPIFNQSMDWERVGLAAVQLGTMRRLLEQAVDFARNRKPGGVAISSHQAVSHVLVDCQVELEAARLLVYQAAAALGSKRSASQLACSAKLFSSELFKRMTVQLMQIHAQHGYTEQSDISLALQDSMASTLYSGTSEIQRNIIARWMGC